MSRPLRLALPAKGRLAEPALRLLRDAGIDVQPDGRRLRLPVPDHDLEILFARPDDIPVWVDDRAVDVGIAGQNQILEARADVEQLLDLGFGHCRLALAAPTAGALRRTEDLDGVRIATSYPRTVETLLDARGIRPQLIPISGSVELAPSLDAAEAIADLVSTGETLRQNGLVELETLVTSQAVLLAPREPAEAVGARVAGLTLVLRSVLAARSRRYLMLNAHDEQLDTVLGLLPGLDAPTVLPLARGGMHAVHSVVHADEVVRLLGPLKSAGATAILVLPIEHLIP